MRRSGVGNPDVYWQQRKDKNRIGDKRLHRFLSNLVDHIAPKSGGRILDCGMGSGHVFRVCNEKHQAYGIELSSEAIAIGDFPTHNIKQADLNDGIPDFGVKFDVIIERKLSARRSIHAKLSPVLLSADIVYVFKTI